MKQNTLHMIGNAHIDPVWLWRWQEGFQEIKATFRSALDRMSEDPDFIFISSSAAFYEWVEENDPAMFAEIQRRVTEGRWEIVGGWWVEPDCNLPCGESLARQGLYGQRYFREKFGVTARVGFNPDSFGHSAMMPQILKKSGMDSYIFMRPMPNEKPELPGSLFVWESDDGSRVPAFRIIDLYLTWGNELDPNIDSCSKHFTGSHRNLMCFYGVGNHGGGPTKTNIASIRSLNEHPDRPNLVFSSPTRFFSAIDPQSLPLVRDELQHHAKGCYSVHSGIKQWNRQAENLLLSAETCSVLAHWVTGQPCPSFSRGWKSVLFNQFHDILAGSSIEAAYEAARDSIGEAKAIAARGLNHAIQSLAWNIRIPFAEGTYPLVVFNPHAWSGPMVVEAQCNNLSEAIALTDDEGRQIPVQKIHNQATPNRPIQFCFVADLPSLGYRTYRLAQADPVGATHASPQRPAATPSDTLENDSLRLTIDPDTGCIASLFDKRTKAELFSAAAAVPTVIDDPSDTWSHDVLGYHDVAGVFKAQKIERVEDGPVRSVVRVSSVFGSSRMIQEFIVYQRLARVDVRVTVDWRERFKALKLRFPMNIEFTHATAEIPYGFISRPANGIEQVGQRWVDVSGSNAATGAPCGLSLLNDCKPAYDVDGNVLSLTVLRSPIYAQYNPLELDPDKDYAFMDQGIQHFSYSLLPHSGDWRAANVIRHAAELNQPPIALLETFHPDAALPQSDSFLTIEPSNIVVGAIKKYEDGDALVIRCYESAGVATDAAVRLPKWGRAIDARFGPCEIKTFLIPRDAAKPVAETNLLEWPME